MYRARAGQPQTPVLKKLIRAMKSQLAKQSDTMSAVVSVIFHVENLGKI